MKFAFIVIRHNPSISEFDEINQHLTEEEGIDLEKNNFQIAIVVTDSSTGEVLHDPRYVDFQVVTWDTKGGGLYKEFVSGMHPCTETEYSKFYKRSITAMKNYDRFKKENAFMCLDDVDKKGNKLPTNLYGV